MDDQLSISSSMTKREIIDKHTSLLDAFRQKSREAEEAQKLASEAEKHGRTEAVKLAQEATVSSVVDNIGKLRIQIGDVLNDLTERMNGQADKLVSLTTAIEVQEKRLAELHDIEAASDSLSKLMQAYIERKQSMEQDYAQRTTELEEEYTDRAKALEKEHEDKAKALQKDMETMKAEWNEQKVSTAKLQKEAQQQVQSVKSDHVWENKVFDERIKHLEETIASQKEKIAELKKDLELAHTQVESIANKAVEGASLTKAFQSVNQIALEQARKTEREEKSR